jgi:arylsulfatase A-like enzyme/Flp pilus assembly protein TadD
MSRRSRKKSAKKRVEKPKEHPSPPDRKGLRPVGIAFLVLILAAVAIGIWSSTRIPPPLRVVFISIDTLRADRLGCYGYGEIETPNIDRLAGDAALFENVATVTPLTLPAHASIFTGLGPLKHGIIDNFGYLLDEDEVTLAEVLRERGFATGGFVGSFVLDARWGLAQGFDTYFDRFDAPTGGVKTLQANQRPGDEVLEPALEWIRNQKEKPFFVFIHFYDPHTPYDPPEPYRTRYGSDTSGRYDGEVAFVDSLVGRLVSVLEEQGLYEETLIVLLGDHGESLGEHGEDTHGMFIYDATVRVPLVIKSPGYRRSVRVPSQVRTIDVMPTVLDLLGIEAPDSVEGVSLRPLLRDPESDLGLLAYVESHYPRLHFGWAPLRGFRDDRYKYVEAPLGELYDLTRDPEESRNLFGDHPDVVKKFAERIRQIEETSSTPQKGPQVLDAETEQRLQALGYVTASVSGTSSVEDWMKLADPKEKIDIFNRVTEATNLNLVGEDELAVDLLTSVIEEAPDVELAYTILGNLYLKRREYREAESVFRAALERMGETFNATYGLALSYKGQGRLEEAAMGFDRSVTLDTSRVRAVFQLAEVELLRGRRSEAETLLREHLDKRPDTSLYLVLADALLAQGKSSEARAILQDAANKDADNAMIHLSVGNLLMEQDDVEGAFRAFQKAKEVAPKEARVFNALGNALARMGNDQSSLENFKTSAELDPSFAPAHNNLGIALARSGRPAEAEKAFRTAIETDPSYAEAFNNLGFLYLQAGAAARSIPLFERAVALESDYAQAQANLEAALLAAGAAARR